MHAISVDNISFGYHLNVPILREISLKVEQGEFLSLAGPNGSGKTTLLRLLDRIFVPQNGSIFLDGRNITRYTRTEIAKRIAFVPQESGIIYPFTVLEVVLMGRAPHSRGSLFENAHDRGIANTMMKLTDVHHLAHHPVTALSGGERQRAFIARALAQQPEILLLDEPNAHLDIAHQIEVFSIIRKLNREAGLTVVSVSHDLNLAAAYSDRMAMLMGGTLAALGTPQEVLTEQRIREVFRTPVLVDTHPSGGSPRVTLLTSTGMS